MNKSRNKVAEYRAPLESRATRKVISKSKRSCRLVVIARLPSDKYPRKYMLESRLEENVFNILLTRRDVYDIHEQPPAIKFVDHDGRTRHHTFDFLVTLKNRRKIAIAVKTHKHLLKSGLESDLYLVREAMPVGFADAIEIVTDRDFDRVKATNARRLCAYRRHEDKEADNRVKAVSRELSDPIKIADLVEQIGLQGRAFRAVFRAIFDGTLEPLDHVVLTPNAKVQQGSGRHA